MLNLGRTPSFHWLFLTCFPWSGVDPATAAAYAGIYPTACVLSGEFDPLPAHPNPPPRPMDSWCPVRAQFPPYKQVAWQKVAPDRRQTKGES